MNYVRLSLMTPRPHARREATRLMVQIVAHCSGQPGYRGGMLIGGGSGDARRIGRLTMWADRASADRVAVDPHLLDLRAALDAIVYEESRMEFSLDAADLSAEPGGEVGLTPGEAVRIAEGLTGRRLSA